MARSTKTTAEWWSETKVDPDRLHEWLIKQYRGEVTAARRIEQVAAQYAPDSAKAVLQVIADQERRHASWVLDLLKARGLEPSIEGAEDRYWAATLPSIESFETAAAVGAHAEAMRLKRIQEIVSDEAAPGDIRRVFKKILKDELFHERAFRRLAGAEALANVAPSHQRGLELLGLTA